MGYFANSQTNCLLASTCLANTALEEVNQSDDCGGKEQRQVGTQQSAWIMTLAGEGANLI